MQKTILAASLGGLLGVIAAQVLFVGSGLSLVPWTIAGLLVGGLASSRGESGKLGAIYGFALAFVFMLTGYSGSASLLSRVPFFTLLGIVGAFAGAALAMLARSACSLIVGTSIAGTTARD